MDSIFKECFDRKIVVRVYSYMRRVLSRERLLHSISVALFAEYLCMRYEVFWNSNKCFLAGLAHDIAREYDHRKYFEVLKAGGISIAKWEVERPVLLHGKVGAMILREKLNIEDEEILEAVSDHVTGRRGMGSLSKVIFVADDLEPFRKFVSREERKRILNKDLDGAVKSVLERTFVYLKREKKLIAPPALSLFGELSGVRT